MKPNDEFIVKIEKTVNEGKGITRIDGFPVFVENAAPRDVLKVKLSKINKTYANAEIIDVIEASPHRIKPLCPMHNVCGSCNWQHIEYSEQLRQKRQIVYETLKNITGKDFNVNETIASPKRNGYRCKVQYPVSQKKSGRLISGYYKKLSHDLINVKYCPMHDFIINEIMEFIKNEAPNFKITGYIETKHSGLLRHVIFRKSSFNGQILVILVINDDKIDTKLKKLADLLMSKFPEITGVCVNFNTMKSNVILGKITKVIKGNDYYIEILSGIKYQISASSFFQVNPYSAEIIFNTVKDLISERISTPSILDAYSGVSSFGIWLSSIASKVVSVEEVYSASSDAVQNLKINNLDNIEIINDDAAKTFKNFINNNIKFDVVLIDPPRKGSSAEALKSVISLAEKFLIYVSCNPATLARDLKFLIEHNFLPEYIQPVDMFPNTSHIETVVLLKNYNKKDAV